MKTNDVASITYRYKNSEYNNPHAQCSAEFTVVEMFPANTRAHQWLPLLDLMEMEMVP